MKTLSLKLYTKLLMSIMFLCTTNVMHTATITVDGIVYQLVGTSAYLYDGKNPTSTDVVIPYAITYNGEEYLVKNIQSNAFQNCDRIYSVVIPDGVVSVGESVFARCENLRTVTIGDGLDKIGEKMFDNCTNLSSISLGKSITCIEKYAFYDCSKLDKIILPESLTKIGDSAFKNCKSLLEIVVPNNIQSIGIGAFSSCESLLTFNWPTSITEIPEDVFFGCSDLESVYLPKNIEKIGDSAFSSCYHLSNINLPATLKVIGSGAFSGCSRLDNFKLPTTLQSIGNYAFASSGISSMVIPGSVTEVGKGCFNLCKSLKKVTFADGVKIIGKDAFYGADNLEEVIFGRAVTATNRGSGGSGGTFSYCRNLKTIVCKSEVVPDGLYSGCKSSFNWSSRSIAFLIPFGTKKNYDSMQDFFNIIEVAMDDLDEEYPTESELKISVSSISLNPSPVEGKEGEQIQISATVLPEDATNKTIRWISSDEDIASVDDTGLISLLKKGTAVITASATDDSGVSADCAIVVTEASGIEDILADRSSYVKIFNLKGILIFEGKYADARLTPDYYIVVCDGKSIKVKVQ